MVRIVPAVENDISRITDIETEAFTPPWTAGALLSELYREDSFFAVACKPAVEQTTQLRHSALDAESHQQSAELRIKAIKSSMRGPVDPIGFVILRCFADDGELLQIAVDRDARRRGIADLLMNAALEYAQKKNLKAVFLEVRKSNAAAVALYKKHGFNSVRLRKDYYSNPLEDALVMVNEQQTVSVSFT